MARKNLSISNSENELNHLVASYYENKQHENNYKKKAATENAQIKKILSSNDKYIVKNSTKNNERSFEVDDIVVTYYDKESKSLDEDALLEFLVNNGYTRCVKTKSYVDMDILEDMLYKNEIKVEDKQAMSRFETSKVSSVLTVKKKKKEDN